MTEAPYEERTPRGKGVGMEGVNPETGEKFKSRNEYTLYRIRQRVNPETEEKFKSRNEYLDYRARQRVNPETGEKFKSRNEYLDYRARQRVNPETGEKFKSVNDYLNYRARQRVNPDTELPFWDYSELSRFNSEEDKIFKKERNRARRITPGDLYERISKEPDDGIDGSHLDDGSFHPRFTRCGGGYRTNIAPTSDGVSYCED